MVKKQYIMVNRNRQRVREVLHSENIVLYPAENQAAKIYAKYMAEHPELDMKDINLNIDEEEREEDYHGNGGGVDRTAVVCRSHEETDWEYNQRVQQEEDEAYIKLSGKLAGVFREFYREFDFSRVAPENMDRVRQRLENIMNTAIYTMFNTARS